MLRTRRFARLLALSLCLPLLLSGCNRSKAPTLAYSGWPTAGGDSGRTNHSIFRAPDEVREKEVINVRCQVTEVVLGLDGVLYVAGRRGSQAVVQAITREGDEMWEYRIADPPKYRTLRPTPNLTAVTDGVYLTHAGALYALSSEGREKWVFKPEPRYESSDSSSNGAKESETAEFLSPLNLPAAVGPDGTVFFVSGLDGGIHALNAGGSERWDHVPKGAGMSSTPVVGKNGNVYVGDGGGVYAFSPNGDVQWDFPNGKGVVSLLTGEDVLYALTRPSSSSGEASLYALNDGGKEVWSDELQMAGQTGHLALGRLGLVADGAKITVLNAKGDREWTFDTEYPAAGVAIDREGTIVRVRGDGIAEVISRNGQEGWAQGLGTPSLRGPVLADDGLMYVWEGSKISSIKD